MSSTCHPQPLIPLIPLSLCNSVSSGGWDFPLSHHYWMHRLLCLFALKFASHFSPDFSYLSPHFAWLFHISTLYRPCLIHPFILLIGPSYCTIPSLLSLIFGVRVGIFLLDSTMWVFIQLSLFLPFHSCPMTFLVLIGFLCPFLPLFCWSSKFPGLIIFS